MRLDIIPKSWYNIIVEAIEKKYFFAVINSEQKGFKREYTIKNAVFEKNDKIFSFLLKWTVSDLASCYN